ncbi:MAG: hypothetical protein JKY92_07995 [Magnetovibrio sp.]|nr:hypothetical protein [Magnetovibrio sp.]
MAAAGRAAEREARRRQRELEKEQKFYDKMEELEQAAYEVECYDNYIDRITSIHTEICISIDWQSIFNEPQPKQPSPENKSEKAARYNFETYSPNFFVKLIGSTEKTKESLKMEINTAIQTDQVSNQKAITVYQENLTQWGTQVELAKGVLANEPTAYKEAIANVEIFSEVKELGSKLNFRFTDESCVFCTIKVHSKSIIPEQSKSLLKSGRLTQKNLAKGKFFELYQDYVCGVVLRVANETFSILPIESITVTASDDILDKKTGHIKEQPIVSAFIPRQTLESLNMDLIDPSDSMENFIHQMNFKKTQGFSAVKEVDPL